MYLMAGIAFSFGGMFTWAFTLLSLLTDTQTGGYFRSVMFVLLPHVSRPRATPLYTTPELVQKS